MAKGAALATRPGFFFYSDLTLILPSLIPYLPTLGPGTRKRRTREGGQEKLYDCLPRFVGSASSAMPFSCLAPRMALRLRLFFLFLSTCSSGSSARRNRRTADILGELHELHPSPGRHAVAVGCRCRSSQGWNAAARELAARASSARTNGYREHEHEHGTGALDAQREASSAVARSCTVRADLVAQGSDDGHEIRGQTRGCEVSVRTHNARRVFRPSLRLVGASSGCNATPPPAGRVHRGMEKNSAGFAALDVAVGSFQCARCPEQRFVLCPDGDGLAPVHGLLLHACQDRWDVCGARRDGWHLRIKYALFRDAPRLVRSTDRAHAAGWVRAATNPTKCKGNTRRYLCRARPDPAMRQPW